MTDTNDTAGRTDADTFESEQTPTLPPERVAELIDAARSEDADLPVGAEDFAEALRIVAAERDEYFGKLARSVADYQNFQRRAANNEREARQMATAGVVQSIITVVDYFDYALQQDPATATVEQVVGGVKLIKSEILRVLGMHGVAAIEPAPGAAFDPLQHEAIEHVNPPEGVTPGAVVDLKSSGYAMGERVVRPAKVTVARDGSAPAAEESETVASEERGSVEDA